MTNIANLFLQRLSHLYSVTVPGDHLNLPVHMEYYQNKTQKSQTFKSLT
jgi:hypothetical protein